MKRGLSTVVKVDKPAKTKHDFNVAVCDIVLDVVEKEAAYTKVLRELLARAAHAFGHDILNLATLAGRLLWYEGVTPDMRRSPDLVAIAVDTENYLVSLRSACDELARIIVHFGVDPKDRGKLPSDSLSDLSRWVKKKPSNLTKLYPPFRFMGKPLPWFKRLRDLRDDLVHGGYHGNIYTDRVTLTFIRVPIGEVEVQMLKGGYREDDEDGPRFTRFRLLRVLQHFTKSLLGFADKIADAIEQQHSIGKSQTHVLNGVYVPALHHLMRYRPPMKRHLMTPEDERRGHIRAWYLSEARDYLGAIEYGYPDGFWWRFVQRISELFSEPPVSFSDPMFSDCGALIDWRFVYREGGFDFALLARDGVLFESEWMERQKNLLDGLSRKAGAKGSLIVARCGSRAPEASDADVMEYLVIDDDPVSAANTAFRRLVRTERGPTEQVASTR